MLARKIGDRIKVVKDYDRSLPPMPAYAAELNQVWTNLIDNAVQAMGGEGTLTIRTYREDDCAVVEIGDTGPGVPDEIAGGSSSRSSPPSRSARAPGSGLDISWRIVVKKHHGDIRVESEPGDTWFLVRLPLDRPGRRPGPRPLRRHRRLSQVGGTPYPRAVVRLLPVGFRPTSSDEPRRWRRAPSEFPAGPQPGDTGARAGWVVRVHGYRRQG